MVLSTTRTDLPRYPAGCSAAACGPALKVYVAVSDGLNALAATGRKPDLVPFVFKCGTAVGAACRRRSGELACASPHRYHPPPDDGRPRYALMNDWRVLCCWPAPSEQYEKKVFFPALAGIPGMRWVNPGYRFRTNAKRSGWHTAMELGIMSHSFLDVGDALPDPVYPINEILSVVRACALGAPIPVSDRPPLLR